MAVADKDNSFIISGNGDVLEPEHGMTNCLVEQITMAAAKAMINSDKSAEEIAKQSIEIAADICIYKS